MEKKEKLDMLRKLNESRLRKEVLVPLFQKMGFKVPPTSHVPNSHLSISPQGVPLEKLTKFKGVFKKFPEGLEYQRDLRNEW